MQILIPPREKIPFGLRAMKMVASADGSFDGTERELLRAAQSFFGTDHDVDALLPITPAELAANVTDPALRQQLVRGMIVLSMVDGEASPKEAEVVEAFAHALGVEMPALATFQRLAAGQLMRVRFDVARRFWAREKVAEMAKEKGFGWLARSLAAMAGFRDDPEISGRYRALGDCPPGSLGRAYFDFIESNGFSMPGEKGSPPEAIALHDLTHVLSGYGTDPAGELQVLGFHAGCRREEKDPFTFLLFGLLQFHLGVRITPITPGQTGHFDPAKMLVGLQRGSACTIDPTDGWDPWPHMDRPLDEVRREYGIAPLPD